MLTENQLDDWVRGNARDAQGVIVELVWRLVAASVPRPKERRFPLGDSIGQHGPDGKLDVDLGFDPFVPDGVSYWEIGTNLDAGAKATADYASLTAATPEAVRKESAFIFVTPNSGRRGWEASWKEEAQLNWLRRRKTADEWKEVRVIDGTVLIDWIDKFPAVKNWLTQTFRGGPIQEIETVEERWDLTRSYGEPPHLVSELFLANRQDAATKLQQVIDDKLTQLKLETHYPDQVVDFVTAYISTLGAEARAEAAGRCLIISSPTAWKEITLLAEKHVLIADSQLDLNNEMGSRLIQMARRKGHSIIFGGARGGIPDPGSTMLATPKIQQIHEGLVKAGYNSERARSLANRSGGNLGALLRCIQNLSLTPQWAEKSASADLAIAVLLGSWNERSEADLLAVGTVAGKSYGEWIATVREAAVRPGTPLRQWESEWRFSARYEGWFTLGPLLFEKQIERASQVATSVLRITNPSLDKALDQRLYIDSTDRQIHPSSALQLGVAEFLALLGSLPSAATSCSFAKLMQIASRAVFDILHEAGWKQWATLNDVLPLLAEASPNTFLTEVESSLQEDECPFDELYRQEGDGVLTGGTYISGLLWALETLAWEPEFFARTLYCLALLAERDPGGRWSNRPANSLRTILLPWHPLTCASVEKRISAVQNLAKISPKIAWDLLLRLLPESHSTSTGTHRPAWRTWIPEDWTPSISSDEYWAQTVAYARLAIELARSDVDRLVELSGRIANLPHDVEELLFRSIEQSVSNDQSGETAFMIWSELDAVVRKHRRYPNAKWAMSDDDLGRIAKLVEKLTPRDPLILNRPLFNGNDVEFYYLSSDFDAARLLLETKRRAAIEEINSNGGFDSVLRFSETTRSAWQVGFTYASISNFAADSLVLPKLLLDDKSASYQFATGFIWSRFFNFKWEWVDRQNYENWSRLEAARFFCILPFNHETWKRVNEVFSLDQRLYWEVANPNMHDADEETFGAIEKLLEYGRPRAAVACLFQLSHENKKIDHSQVAKALSAAVNSDELQHQMDEYSTVELIKLLQKSDDADRIGLARLEWAYLPLLEHLEGAQPVTIGTELAENPQTFCEMIRLVFRSRGAEKPIEPLSEERKNIATNAYRLLSTWTIVPGVRNGTLKGEALNKWVEQMQQNAEQTGHLEISQEMFGRVLTHAPEDPSGLWIHLDVAAVLDRPEAKIVREGFRMELFNSRGAHWVDPTGAPERELAQKFRKYAETIEDAGFIRLAASLRSLSEEYDREALKVVERGQREE